jgi:CRISPR-associated endonuclease Csn1
LARKILPATVCADRRRCRTANRPATGDEQPLSKQHRALLLDKLSKTKEMTFDQIRKALGFLETIPFNLEGGKRKKLQGMVTDAILADKKLFGPAWHTRKNAEKTQIARCLIHGTEAEIRRQATDGWGLEAEAAERLLDVDLPAGYIRLSIAALEKLVPHMERGLLYMTADGTPSALSEAAYGRPDQRCRKVLERLPEPPEVTNPVVRQALFELRKVVNCIVKTYGKPARIHLELARNATATAEQRRKMSQNMRDRGAQRDKPANRSASACGGRLCRPRFAPRRQTCSSIHRRVAACSNWPRKSAPAIPRTARRKPPKRIGRPG